MESLAATLGPQNIRVNGLRGICQYGRSPQIYDRFPQIKADIEAKAHLKPSFMDPKPLSGGLILADRQLRDRRMIALDSGFHIELKRYFQDT